MPGRTVREVLEELCRRHPDLQDKIFTATREIRPFRTIFVNEQDVDDLQGLETLVADTDHVFVCPWLSA